MLFRTATQNNILPLRMRHTMGGTLHTHGDRGTPRSDRKRHRAWKHRHRAPPHSPTNSTRNHSKSGPILKKVVVHFTLKITYKFTIKKLKSHYKENFHLIFQYCKYIHHFIQIVLMHIPHCPNSTFLGIHPTESFYMYKKKCTKNVLYSSITGKQQQQKLETRNAINRG